MFSDAEFYNQDMSDLDVSGISSMPNGFDKNSGFEGQTDIQAI